MGIKRAAHVFRFEEWGARSPMVERVWRTTSGPEQSFLAVAATHWEIVATRQEGPPQLGVLGPQRQGATAAPIPEEAEFLGIHFSIGAFMPSLAPGRLVDGRCVADGWRGVVSMARAAIGSKSLAAMM